MGVKPWQVIRTYTNEGALASLTQPTTQENYYYRPNSHVYLRTGNIYIFSPIPVAARSETWVFGWSLAGIAGSNLAGIWMYFVTIVCCLRRGYHASRGLRCVWVWSRNLTEEAMSHLGCWDNKRKSTHSANLITIIIRNIMIVIFREFMSVSARKFGNSNMEHAAFRTLTDLQSLTGYALSLHVSTTKKKLSRRSVL
jgi:hypothetical protein